MIERIKNKAWYYYATWGAGLLLFAGMILICSRSRAIRPTVFLIRTAIILCMALFYSMHFVFDIHKMYDWIYKNRWYIGIAIFVVCVINKFHFSSISVFDMYIQPGEGSEFVRPILGVARPIRSDEWLVGLTKSLTGWLTHFAKYNDIVRAVKTTNVSASGYYLDYSILADPSTWGTYLLGAEYGLSFSWCYKLIFGFLVNFELFLILTKEKKLLSLFGACLTWFSMFTMWWSIVSYMLSGPAIIVLFYYFTKEKNRLKRLLIGAALAIIGSNYVVGLYPAWQVPLGWIIVSIMIWILCENTDWKTYEWKDWLIFIVDVAFMVSIIARYLYVDQEYMTAIMNTVYPGSRVFYGGYALDKLLGYFSSIISTFGGYENPCEMGVIFGVYPLAIVLLLYVQYKEKWKNKLLWFLTAPLIMLTMYCTFELPPFLAKILMLTYSTPFRTVDFLGVLLAYILIICLSELQELDGVPYWLSFVFCFVCVIPAAINAWKMNAGLKVYAIIVIIIATIILETIIVSSRNNRLYKIMLIAGSVMFAIDGLAVNPLVRGYDAITSKPVAGVIREIVKEEPKAKWVALDSIITGNYLIACGARTINCVNYIPNTELWAKLDPTGENDYIYNRYAHFNLSLTDSDESAFDLVQADLMHVTLNEEDFSKMDVDYIYSNSPISLAWETGFELLYDHNGAMIYKVIR